MRGVVFLGPGSVRSEDIGLPSLGGRDVLLEVEACGVCGSDLASYAHGHYVEPGQVMGHEMSAVVLDHGPSLAGLPIGCRVAVRPMRSCDDCAYCRVGDTHLCGSTYGRSLGYGPQGGFAERVMMNDVVVGRDLVPVADDVDPFDLLWAEPLAVALHALSIAGSTALDRLLIAGAGPVGLAVAAAAIAEGVVVDVVEPVGHRRDAARSLGAEVHAPGDLPPAPVFDALVDASGVPPAVRDLLPVLRPPARVVLVGLNDLGVPWPVGGRPLAGAFGYRDSEFARSVELIASGRVRLGRFVTHRFGLDEAGRALSVPSAGDHVVKTAIVPARKLLSSTAAGPTRHLHEERDI